MGKLLDSIMHGSSKPTDVSGGGVPQMSLMPVANAQGPDPLMAAMGMGQAPSQGQGISLADLYAPQAQQQAPAMGQPPAAPDNPYTPADNVGPQAIAQSIGTPDAQPISVVGDAWKPHKESKLGRFMDTMLQMDGHAPVFQNRTDERNLKDAMQGTDKDPQLLLDRVKRFNPELAWKMQQDMGAMDANKALEEQRVQVRQDQGRNNLTGMLKSIQMSKDPAAVYTSQLPMLRKYAESYKIPTDELPDQYDADAVNTYTNQSTTPYQQEALAQNKTEHSDLQTERESDVSLRKTSLGIEEYNAQTSRMNASTARDSLSLKQDNPDTMAQKQALYKKVLGGAASIPWLYGGFVKGVFGGGSSGIPKPGTAYVSPDKTMAVKMNSNGSWSIYDLSKGINHAREIRRLGGVIAGADNGEDFSN